jgi:ribosomal protein S26
MELQRKFNFTPHKLKKEINKHTIKDEKTDTISFMNSAFPKLYNVIIYCLNQIGIQKELLDQNIIIDDIIRTLKGNGILFNENEFKKMSNKIMLCILLLLHLSTLQIDEKSKEEMPYCSILVDKLGNTRDELYLGLYGILNSPEGDGIKLAFPIISTNLMLSEYCDDYLLNDMMNSKTNNEITCPLEFSNFKLSYSSKSKKEIKNAIIFILRDRGNGNKRLEIISLKDSTKHKES